MPNVVITSAGLAALVNAENNGTLPVKITKIRARNRELHAVCRSDSPPEQIQRNYGTVRRGRWRQHNSRHHE